MILQNLSGQRIFITGGTGFVGTALVERLLRCVPDCQLVLLVRDGRRSSAEQRVQKEILRNDCFDRLREELGTEGFEQMTSRVQAVSGDVGTDGLGLDEAGRAALASCTTVIHSAATVAFDSPLDRAVEVNLLGPVRIAEMLHELARHLKNQWTVTTVSRPWIGVPRLQPLVGLEATPTQRAVRLTSFESLGIGRDSNLALPAAPCWPNGPKRYAKSGRMPAW